MGANWKPFAEEAGCGCEVLRFEVVEGRGDGEAVVMV